MKASINQPFNILSDIFYLIQKGNPNAHARHLFESSSAGCRLIFFNRLTKEILYKTPAKQNMMAAALYMRTQLREAA